VIDEAPPRSRLLRLIGRWLAVVGTGLLLAGFVWFWWQGVPALYRTAGSDENARLNAVTTTRAALLALFVGLGALGTFWLNSRVNRITARTFELTERGHLTDRYAKGIEQLGNDNLRFLTQIQRRPRCVVGLGRTLHPRPRAAPRAAV
jgi:hypothetical protein